MTSCFSYFRISNFSWSNRILYMILTSKVECCKLALGGCENLTNLFLYRERYRSRSIYIAAMVLFKNRYLVMEMVASQGRRLADARVSPQDLSNAIRDSLLGNFGEHGLAASLPALQGKRTPCFHRLFTLFISIPYHDDVLKNCQNIAQETSSQSIVLLRVLWSYETISFSSEVMRP